MPSREAREKVVQPFADCRDRPQQYLRVLATHRRHFGAR